MAEAVIIVPTLRGGALLESCLGALDRQTWRNFEVVIVDNGGIGIGAVSLAGIRVRVIRPSSNVGFGAAINLGMKASTARLVVTLNDDTEPADGWLKELVREIRSHDRAGMCASRILNQAAECLDSAGMLICFDGSSKQRGGQMPAALFDAAGEALLPSACAAIYRRDMLEELGGFDEDFFLYCEDTDVGLRAQWAGWQCRYSPGAIVRHRYSATAGPASFLKARYVERNRLWVAIKNFPVPILLAVPLVSAVRYLFQYSATTTRCGSAAQFLADHSISAALSIVARAHWETLAALPALLRKRAAVRNTRRIGVIQFIRLLYAHRMGLRDLARA